LQKKTRCKQVPIAGVRFSQASASFLNGRHQGDQGTLLAAKVINHLQELSLSWTWFSIKTVLMLLDRQ
jgi:hypothetical protein